MFISGAIDEVGQIATGAVGPLSRPIHYRTIPFEQFEITVVLTDDNKLIGISQVSTKKDFLTIQQRVAASGFLDVEKYYED